MKTQMATDRMEVSFSRPVSGKPGTKEYEIMVKTKEKRLMEILSPMEDCIMCIQRILVWENPRQSAAMMMIVNGIFWLYTCSSYRFFYLFAMTGMIIVFSEMWKTRIWPEIRVPPKEEDQEGWTEVRPDMMGVPEVCHHIAELQTTTNYYSCWLWHLRTDSPAKFCLLSCSIFLGLMVVGHYISGVTLSYITMMSLLLWPCIVYHDVLHKAYVKVEPYLMKIEYTMKIKRKKTKKGKKSGRRRKRGEDFAETDSDEDVVEFCPSPNPEISAALARAITDSEDESLSPTMLTPRVSKEPSLIDSEEEILMEGSFSAGLSEIPSFDETSIQEISSLTSEVSEPVKPAKAAAAPAPASDSIRFEDSHFRDSDSDSGDELVAGLAFPDVHSELTSEPKMEASTENVNATLLSAATEIVSKTLTSVTAASMLSRLSQSVIGSAAASARITELPAEEDKKSDGDDTAATGPSIPQALISTRQPSEDSDLADFELLDESELDIETNSAKQ